MITASQVKELREKTNVGMMECKQALKECDGDMDAAVKYLRERGAVKAAKKADREAKEGIVAAKLSDDGKSGVLIEVNCETDFVAKNDNFVAFVNEVLDASVASGASDVEGALAADKGGESIDAFIKAKVIEIGENLQLRRLERFDVSGEGAVASYIHLGGKVGVLLEVATGKAETAQSESFQDLVKDLTLHIAAAAPSGLSRDDIPAELVEAEKDIFRKQMEGQNKPENIIEKIIEGKLSKFYSEQCFLEQGFIKDPDTTVRALVESKAKELGDSIEIKRFVRFGLGE
ncbi:MAG: translation elongation factor Ts [Verrucomicrobiales bacterium]